MNEKTITLTVLAIVTIVAVVALVLLLKSSKAGMVPVVILNEGNTMGEGRYLGSGVQSGTGVGHSITMPGIYTAGSGSISTNTGRAYFRIPNEVASTCMPTDANGNLITDQNGEPLKGSLQTKKSPDKMTTIEQGACVTDNFAVSSSAMYNDAELAFMMCCVWGRNIAIPSAVQSTGVAHYYSVK